MLKKVKDKIIPISQEESLEVERLFFEYNSIQDLLRSICYNDEVNLTVLQYWKELFFNTRINLENKKMIIGDKYNPDKKIYTNYQFLFNDYCIRYYVEKK